MSRNKDAVCAGICPCASLCPIGEALKVIGVKWKMRIVCTLGYPAKKMSLRESVMRKGVKADSRLSFGEVFFDGSFDKPLTKEAAGKLADALEAVRLAPSAVNKQPWRIVLSENLAHIYEKRNRRNDDGAWDIQIIDMGIALYHFELVLKELGVNGSPIRGSA